jgi:hypothetical protein
MHIKCNYEKIQRFVKKNWYCSLFSDAMGNSELHPFYDAVIDGILSIVWICHILDTGLLLQHEDLPMYVVDTPKIEQFNVQQQHLEV